jgi:FkbM family methyltransferase
MSEQSGAIRFAIAPYAAAENGVSANAINEQERRLVREFFCNAPRGYFVEVGANDPHERSQTWHLEQAGWSGILIEPQPDLAEKLRQARKARVYAVACSSPRNGGGVLPFHVAGPLSSLDRDRMAPGSKPEAVIDVPTKTLDQILQEANAPTGFDFLSIDVEGHELEVLQGFGLRRWRPRLILLEDHVGSLAKHRFLHAAGYRLIRRFDNNGWYVPADAAPSVPWRERWNILRKYYLALPFRMARNFSRALRRGHAP